MLGLTKFINELFHIYIWISSAYSLIRQNDWESIFIIKMQGMDRSIIYLKIQHRTNKLVPLSTFGRKCLNRTLILFVGARRLAYVVKKGRSKRGGNSRAVRCRREIHRRKEDETTRIKAGNPRDHPTKSPCAPSISSATPCTTPPPSPS